MKIEAELKVFITGAGSGIGQALALAFARSGASVAIVDFIEANGLHTLQLVNQVHEQLRLQLQGPAAPRAIFVKCDVTKQADIAYAFETHKDVFGRLDICVNCAGISGHGDFLADDNGGWRTVIDVNFSAVVECTRYAVKAMREYKNPGVIINFASASGLYPAPLMPIYSGSKGGVVLFTRSLVGLRKEGIRVNVLCPEFVETPMTTPLNQKVIEVGGGYVPMAKVVQGVFQLIEDESKAGACLWITTRRGLEYWPTEEEEAKYLVRGRRKPKAHGYKPATQGVANLPSKYQKVIVRKLSSNFREATEIIPVSLRLPLKPGHVLIKYYYAGVNASDVNFSAGRYFGSEKNALEKLPFDAGFEAVGVIVARGDNVEVKELNVGSAVATMTYGGFSEFSEVPAKFAIPIPAPTPEVVAILLSGLTASIGLQEAGQMKSGETVLVTAAAGGTGQFAVQLAKLSGNHVVATCGGSDKARLLASLGVDRVIDYKVEDVKTVLKTEYPGGVNLVYESVGGKMFDTCLNALATFGRLVIIGMISEYQGEAGWKPRNYPGIGEKLLWRSQTLVGFFLMHYTKLWRDHVQILHGLHASGKLKVAIDPTPFTGIASIADAVEFLHSGRSVGKVVVKIANDAPQSRL